MQKIQYATERLDQIYLGVDNCADRSPGDKETDMRYDTIIVGAGSAGAILATRMTEDLSSNAVVTKCELR